MTIRHSGCPRPAAASLPAAIVRRLRCLGCLAEDNCSLGAQVLRLAAVPPRSARRRGEAQTLWQPVTTPSVANGKRSVCIAERTGMRLLCDGLDPLTDISRTVGYHEPWQSSVAVGAIPDRVISGYTHLRLRGQSRYDTALNRVIDRNSRQERCSVSPHSQVRLYL